MTLFETGPGSGGGQSRVRPHGNLAVLRVSVLVLFAILAVRLASMQIVNGEEYRERALNNHIQSEQILPSRGLIYDANGIPLVENVGFYHATIVPELLPTSRDRQREIFLYLEGMLGVPSLEIDARVAQAIAEGNEDQAIPVKKYLTREEALKLAEVSRDMPGVSMTIEPGRRYIGGNAFSAVLGYIGPMTAEEWAYLQEEGYQFNQPVGKAGIESQYESELRGTVGWSSNEVDAAGDIVKVLDTEEPEAGNAIRLSVDAELQAFVEELLVDTMGEATKAAAVVMEVDTGAVRAMVSVPTYDNNIFSQLETHEDAYEALIDDPRKPLLNQAINPAAPGSVFKLATAAAGLEEGNIVPSTGFDVSSQIYEFKGEDGVSYPYKDWAVHGYVDLYSAIARSSNLFFFAASCGFPELGYPGLGSDVEDSMYRLRYWARSLGYGRQSGIDIPGEATGIIPDPEWKWRVTDDPYFREEDRLWYHADTCFSAIGQGNVLATPLQVTRATAAIANGGKLVVPRLAWDVLSPEGEVVHQYEPEWEQVPISPEHLEVIRTGMVMSVNNEWGAGALASRPGLAIAGKTGTAEFNDENGVLREHAWFTGFYPIEDPQIAVTVYYDLGVGGGKAAPAAGEIIEFYAESVVE